MAVELTEIADSEARRMLGRLACTNTSKGEKETRLLGGCLDAQIPEEVAAASQLTGCADGGAWFKVSQ